VGPPRRAASGIHRCTRDLASAIDRYIHVYVHVYNEQPNGFTWTKTADEILARVADCRHRISDSARWWLRVAVGLHG